MNSLDNDLPCSVFGFGNPLVDFLAPVSAQKLQQLNAQPGSMTLVGAERSEQLVTSLTGNFQVIPGGSCANTLRGIAWLGGTPQPALAGAIGKDAHGTLYQVELRQGGVRSALVQKSQPTGTSVVLITADGERTMFTYLGASRDVADGDVNVRGVADAVIFYATGYMWDTAAQRRILDDCATVAGENRRLVAFDMADIFVVDRYGAAMKPWLEAHVDVLFGNRAELQRLTGLGSDRLVLDAVANLATTVVMKTGAEGCWVVEGGQHHRVQTRSVEALDTTGAGDSFAAGFLWGLLRGVEPVRCAVLANLLAGQIVQVSGCDYASLARSSLPAKP